MYFDENYLAVLAGKRAARDERLRSLGADDLEGFKQYLKASEVGNEADTDEYRETQPFKGLTYIAAFMADFRAGLAACDEMRKLTIKWLENGANLTEAYAGSNELTVILDHCFDFAWEEGEVGLYEPYDDELLADEILEWRKHG